MSSALVIILSIVILVSILIALLNFRTKKNIGLSLSSFALAKKIQNQPKGRWYLILTSAKCHQCHVMKSVLQQANVVFREVSIEENIEEIRALKIMGTPTTLIMNDDLIENIKTGVFTISN